MGKAVLPRPGMLGSGSSTACEMLLLALSEQQGSAGQRQISAESSELFFAFTGWRWDCPAQQELAGPQVASG